MESIDYYLEHIGMDSQGVQEIDSCEVCGNSILVVVRDSVVVQETMRAPIRVGACTRCGYLSQLDRFDANFYSRYYAEKYRLCISSQTEPSEGFIQDQIERGKYLFENLSGLLPPSGSVLDVGSGPGGLLVMFHQQGWQVQGIDPDQPAIEFGRKRFGFELQAKVAEELVIQEDSLDLIIITGSLEHVTDPNRVLQLCHKALRVNGLSVIEGWAFAQARLLNGFGHNQKRYLTLKSINNFLTKHGFLVEKNLDFPICGPSRPYSICGIGRKKPSDNDAKNGDLFVPMNFNLSELLNKLDALCIL
jgi:2-polyprenyl-3-methyl-5-hydroxy-6-metoxy-1,4-benzoquinol methylase